MSFRLPASAVALLFVACTLAACSRKAADPLDDPAVATAASVVTGDSIAAHIAFLADDRLEGRDTGSRGHAIAAAYVAGEYRSLGLVPAAGGDFIQKVPFVESRVDRGATKMWLVRDGHEEPLVFARDYVTRGNYLDEEVETRGAAVFVGYGVRAPELGYDDYAGVDVRGRIVVMLGGAPPDFPADQRAYHSWRTLKSRDADAQGAIGVVTVRSRTDEKRFPWKKIIPRAGRPSMRRVEPDGSPADVFPRLRIGASLSPDASRRLFAGAPMSWDAVLDSAEASRPPRFDLPVKIHLRVRQTLRHLESQNVVGVLRGSDPRLRDEYVAYTAHLDHLGIGAPVKGDSIYNGAYDNASGVSMMIEAARALAALPTRPRRSILFAAVTGEEKGEQGSEYLVENPPVPIDHIVANVNLDMFLMLFPVRTVIGYGAGHSSLGPTSERALQRYGLRLVPDPHPEEVVFIRSDQFSFVRKGIPAIFLEAGTGSGDPSVDGAKATLEWRRNIYHSPQDDLSQKMDLDSGVRATRACFAIGVSVADTDARPTWNDGDFFGKTFAAGKP